jgi:hypothetical protein
MLHVNSTWYLVSSFATTASPINMSILPSIMGPAAGFRIQDFPALASLRLGDEDLRILTQQGFLSREIRRGKAYFKLRFRRGRHQHVKYVGAGQITAVRAELNKLQAAACLKRKLAAVTRDAQQTLRQTKRNLQPVLESHGFAFHGLAIRRRRRNKLNELNPPPNRRGSL